MTLVPSRPLRPFTVGYRWTKSCKRVTRKLLTWSDNDNNMYLGPVVGEQQLDPSPQHAHLREAKKGGGGGGGGGGTPTAAKSSEV